MSQPNTEGGLLFPLEFFLRFLSQQSHKEHISCLQIIHEREFNIGALCRNQELVSIP